jgi:hypothetical protein
MVAAEMIAVDSGLGYLVIDARNSGKRYDLVVAAMLTIGLIGLALDLGFRRCAISARFVGGSAMSLKRKIVIFGCGWLALISALHAYLNVNWAAVLNDYRPSGEAEDHVAYIPVTCQLTCPVTDYISKLSDSGEIFLPRLFQGFPEIKEALISNRIQAAFIVAPLAIALRRRAFPSRWSIWGIATGAPWW